MSGKKKPRSKQKPEAKADFLGFGSDDSGPRELIDLSDIKDELVKEAEDETEVVTSTPFVTPVHSPDRQACVESNSVKKSRELFESLDKTEVKVAREVVIPSFGGGISPVKPTSSSSENLTSAQGQSKISSITSDQNSAKMVVDEATATKSCDKLQQVVRAAEDDVGKAKVLFSGVERKIVTMRSVQSRLTNQVARLLKYEKEVLAYKGNKVDISVVIMQSEDARIDLDELIVRCEEEVKEVLAA